MVGIIWNCILNLLRLKPLYNVWRENGINFVHPIMEQPWGQQVVRFYDPDGHIVEIGEPLSALVKRLKTSGMNEQQISERTRFIR